MKDKTLLWRAFLWFIIGLIYVTIAGSVSEFANRNSAVIILAFAFLTVLLIYAGVRGHKTSRPFIFVTEDGKLVPVYY